MEERYLGSFHKYWTKSYNKNQYKKCKFFKYNVQPPKQYIFPFKKSLKMSQRMHIRCPSILSTFSNTFQFFQNYYVIRSFSIALSNAATAI